MVRVTLLKLKCLPVVGAWTSVVVDVYSDVITRVSVSVEANRPLAAFLELQRWLEVAFEALVWFERQICIVNA
jgi:hypothetical protein